MLSKAVCLAMLVGIVVAQRLGLEPNPFENVVQTGRFSQVTTPRPQVPIIRHINKVNNDGSYTFGYEGGDGTFRVETRGLDGVIKGKYGYVDEQGQRKEVDYLAGSATGYEPSGVGITVPPRPPPRPAGQEFLDYDDGSWRAPSANPQRPTRVRVQQPSAGNFIQRQHQMIPQATPPPPTPAPQRPIQMPMEIPRPVAISRPVVSQQLQQQIDFISNAASLPAQVPSSIASNQFETAPVASFRAPSAISRPQSIHSGASPIETFLRQHLHVAQ